MAIGVAAGFENRSLSHLGHTHERVRSLCRLNRITGHLDAAIRAILETHRAAQARGQLSMALALGGARANGAPTHQVGYELRAQQIEKLRAHRQPQCQDIQQQQARHFQALVDGERAIQVRIVDIALPAHGRARLLEIHPHHDQQVIGKTIRLQLELARILDCLIMVMDGTWAHHQDQPVILSTQHARYRATTMLHQRQCFGGYRQPLLQQCWCDQRSDGANPGIVNTRCILGRQSRPGLDVHVHGRIVAIFDRPSSPPNAVALKPVATR